MRRMLMIESGVRGLLVVNGCFCGPVDAQGQAFPVSAQAEVYLQHFALSGEGRTLNVELVLEDGRITRLNPPEQAYALCWPDGVIELELRPGEIPAQEETAGGVLLRYLALRQAGDGRAASLLLRPEVTPALPAYDAVVPLRFTPLSAPDRFDARAGLVTRLAPNVARVDAALATTVPAGQGRRLIESIEVWPS